MDRGLHCENLVLFRHLNPTEHELMFPELPNELILYSAGAFVLGWLVSAIIGRLRSRRKARERDPRDSRIRELDAELRIAQGKLSKSQTEVERLEDELKETVSGIERRDNVISDQQAKLEKIAADLRDSVAKTRELRAELTERATENVHAEARLREVETELSIAQASTDMIASGIFDSSLAPDKEGGASVNEKPSADVSKKAT
jgi:DNA repair exonuclease SbcCD ATPase subunit